MSTPSFLKRLPPNPRGRDFAVGDIHGCFRRLQQALEQLGFDPSCDRLLSVGDLVDRGPESLAALDWLERPWFHAISGNHEFMLGTSSEQMLIRNGGRWFVELAPEQQRRVLERLESLPVLMEVPTASGLIGLVHADVPGDDWPALSQALAHGPASRQEFLHLACRLSRGRLVEGREEGVRGVRAVMAGHTPLEAPRILGNVYHLDTGAWWPGGGQFTFVELDSLTVHGIAVQD